MGDGNQMMDNGTLTMGDQFPYNPSRVGPLMVQSSGHCDPSMGDVRERLSPFRQSLVAFRGTIAGQGSPIVFAGGTEVVAFAVGVGDDGAQAGLSGTLTRAETNTQPLGGLVQQDQSFIAIGAYVQLVEPWTVAPGASLLGTADNAAPRNFRAFLRSPASPYNRVITQALTESVGFQLRNGPATACQFDMGPLALWGAASGTADVKSGQGGIPGAFFFLSTPDVSGGSQSGRQMQVQLRNERSITIESDTANPTSAACDVAGVFRIVWVGYPECNDPQGPTKVDALIERKVNEALAKQSGRVR